MVDRPTRSRYVPPALIILLLILMYVGPYAFVYARTATQTFPKIDERDFEAFEGLEPMVSPIANLTNIQSINGAQEAT